MYETCALRKQSTVRLTVGLSPTIILRRENEELREFTSEYYIPFALHPVVPAASASIADFPEGKKFGIRDAALKVSRSRVIVELCMSQSTRAVVAVVSFSDRNQSTPEGAKVETWTLVLSTSWALEEFDLKSALFKHMNQEQTATEICQLPSFTCSYEALIAYEMPLDNEVAVKRKHDSDDDEDDDDDEGPSAGSNQGRSTKRRRSDSAASGSAKPPPKADDQSSKKPRESEASASKQHPTLSSTGWQITDTREAGVDSSMHRSDPESEHSGQSSDDISKQDEGNDSDMEDTDNAHIPKTIPQNDFPELEHNWANAYATTFKVPEENKLQRKTYDIGSFIKWFCRRTGKKKLCKADLEGPAFNLVKAFHKNSVFLQYQMDECHKLLTNKVDLSNPEGHQIPQNINEPLPLGGPPGQVTIQPQFFFNKDLDYLLTGDKERKIALSISKLKAARYLDFGLEELVPSLWVESEREYDISAVYGITHWWFRRKEFYINKHSESSDREAVRSQMRILNKGMETRSVVKDDKTAIVKKTTDPGRTLSKSESFVGMKNKDIDYS
ncbi:hypothetical protein Tco_0092003 [Tanacetum coccineum]